jgi:hypothetical protein
MEPNEVLPIETYNSDTPVSELKEDEFDRYEFAKRIAQTIQQRKAHDSLTIALYARWGEGKTSVLNFIRRELSNDSIIVVSFNPWRFAGEAQLLMGFFAEFAKALDISLRDIGKGGDDFREYSHLALNQALLMKAFSGSGDTHSPAVDAFVEQAALEGLKRKIELQLSTAGKRVVIIIDDIDRLTKVEIQALFRLIKLTVDFCYTTYLLAFDDHMVAKAIGEAYEGGDEVAGRSFLEKIIQVPLRLPIIQPQVMLRFFIEKVNQVLRFTQTDISKDDGDRFAGAAQSSIVPILTAPRHVVRYCNTIGFILPLLHGETNTADVMLIEALKLFYPQAYDFLAKQQEAVVGTPSDNLNVEYIKEQLEPLLTFNNTPLMPRSGRALIYAMFPAVHAAYSSKSGGLPFFSSRRASYNENEFDSNKRIASPYYFKRYFSYAVQPGEIPDVVFKSFIENVISGNEDATYAQAIVLLERVKATELFRRIIQITKEVAAANASTICKTYARLSDKIDFDSTPMGWSLGIASQVIKSIITLLEKLSGAERLAVATGLIQESASLKFSQALLHDIEKRTVSVERKFIDDDGVEDVSAPILFTPDDFKQFIRVFVQRIQKEAAGQALFSLDSLDIETFLLYSWPLVDAPEVIQGYIYDRLEANPEELIGLLRSIASKVSTNGGPYIPSSITIGQYNHLRTVLDSQYLYDVGMKLLNGKPIIPPKGDRESNITDEERLHQFMYRHQQNVQSSD